MALRKNLKKSFKPRRSSKKRIVRKALGKSWKKSVSRVVKKVISRQAEVKSFEYEASLSPCTIYGNALAGNTNPSSGGSYTNFYGYNVIPLHPASTFIDIQQGTAANQRSGNQLSIKSAKMRLVLLPRPYAQSSNPSDSNRPTNVTFMLVSPRLSSAAPATMCDIFGQSMFQKVGSGTPGVSTSIGYTSTLFDTVRSLNKDVITVHWTRTYKIGHDSYNNNLATDDGFEYWANNDYKMNKIISFNFTKHIPKNIRYNDNTGAAQCRTLYLLVLLAKPDGTSYTALPSPQFGPQPIDMWYKYQINYTDM